LAAASGELDLLLYDAKWLLRGITAFLSKFNRYHLDGIVHFFFAAGIFLLAARFVKRWKAVVLTLLLIALKEVVDVPVKLKLIRQQEAMTVTADTIWDVAAGLLGLLAAFGLVWMLGERWRARPPVSRPLQLPAGKPAECSRALSWIVLIGLIAAGAAVVGGFEVAGLFLERPLMFWASHVVAIGLAVALYALLGPGLALAAIVPMLPFLDWAQRMLAYDKLHMSSTLLIALAVCHAVRLLKTERRVRLGWPGRLVALYSAYACVIVLINCFRLGWTIERAYYVVPPVVGFAAFFVAADALRRSERIKWALGAWAVGFLAVTLIAVLEFFVKPLRLEHVPGSVYGQAPALSPYLTLVWPFLLAPALIKGVRGRPLYWAAGVVGLVTIGLVYVRAGWVAAAVALCLLIVLAAFRRDWALGVGAALAIIISIGTLVGGVRATDQVGLGPPQSKYVREAASILWPKAYGRARGGAASAGATLVRRSPWLGETGRTVNTLHHAHAITYGVPGTVLAALAILSVLAGGWVMAFRTRRRLPYMLAAGATAAVVAVLLHGLAWSAFIGTSLQPFLWYVLGIVAAGSAAARADAQGPPNTGEPPQ